MNRSAVLATLLLLLTLTFSCKDDPSSDGIDVAVMDEFEVLLWESLDENFRSFHINLETIKSDFCENTNIETESSSESGNISISIKEITETTCTSSTFPATSNFEIGVLDKKDHNFQINLQEVVYNYGKLKVTDDFYEIEMDIKNGIVIPNTRLYKIPENTIWGYTAFADSTVNTIASDFINDVENLTAEKIYEDGYYGYFSSENNELTMHHQNILQDNHSTFGFEYQGDYSDLVNLLNAYRSEFPEVEFKIFTSTGEAF